MPRHIAVLTGLLTAATVGVAAADEPPLPNQPLDTGHAYLFTQQHQDNLYWWNGTWVPQTVPAEAHVQVQLPSNPTEWTPVTDSECTPSPLAGEMSAASAPRAWVELLGGHTLPNTGRMDGSSELSIFDYRVHGVGITALCLRPDHQPDPGRPTAPAGDYILTLVVGVPQAGMP